MRDRDATGAVVSVGLGGEVVTRTLFAGDGYHSSNEKRVVLGVGSTSGPVRVTIKWLGGETQHFEGIPVGASVILREGRAEILGAVE